MYSKLLDLVCLTFLANDIHGQQADIQVSWYYHEVLSPTTARRRKWQKGPKSTSVSFPLDRRFADHDIITTQKHAYTCRPSSICHKQAIPSIYLSHARLQRESRYNHCSEGVHLLIYRKDDTTTQLLVSSPIFVSVESGSDLESGESVESESECGVWKWVWRVEVTYNQST